MNNKSANELPVIQSLWIGQKLSVMERLCIASFLNNGHEFHLYTYSEIDNIPEGAVLKDASEIVPSERIFKYKDRDSYSGFSNIFRYQLLLERGNYWVDTDVICLSPFNIKSDYVFASAVESGEHSAHVESCVIRAPHGSEIMEYCLHESSKYDPSELIWGQIGPDLLNHAVGKYSMKDYVRKPYTFCPILSEHWYKFLTVSLCVPWIEMAKMAVFKTKAVHLWNEVWRLKGVDKDACFPKRCIYERLKKRYVVNT